MDPNFYTHFRVRDRDLLCGHCGEAIVEEVGVGDPEDNTIDRLMFLAQDHRSLYCNG